MIENTNHWTKTEMHIYILLLCANADSNATDEEINLIKSKCNKDTFDKIYKEFLGDNEETGLDKIEDNVHFHQYSHLELAKLKKEMRQIFLSDNKLTMMEENLDQILDNIIY